MMIFVNEAYKGEKIYVGFIEGLVQLLSPICPHVCEEMWQELGHNESIAKSAWPKYDDTKTVDNVVVYAVSVNGKLRDKIEASLDASKEEIEKMALDSQKVKNFTDGHEIVKIIVVPKKIVNIVVK